METESMPQKRKTPSPLEIIFVFSEQDIAANQQGEISKWQDARIADYGSWLSLMWGLLIFIPTGIVISAVVIAAKVYPLLIVSLAIIAFGIGSGVSARRRRANFQADYQAREVKVVQGLIKLKESWRYVPLYHLQVEKHTLPIAKWQYMELKRYFAKTNERNIQLKVYYLPHSQYILSVERIPYNAMI